MLTSEFHKEPFLPEISCPHIGERVTHLFILPSISKASMWLLEGNMNKVNPGAEGQGLKEFPFI